MVASGATRPVAEPLRSSFVGQIAGENMYRARMSRIRPFIVKPSKVAISRIILMSCVGSIAVVKELRLLL